MAETNSTIFDETVICKKCTHCINTKLNLFVVCNGICGNSFHISCIGMSRNQLRVLSRAVLWICEDCLPAFNDWKHAQQKSSSPADMNHIVSEIAELRTQISSIVNKLQLDSPIPNNESVSRAFLCDSTPIASGTNIYDMERDQIERSDGIETVLDDSKNLNDRCFSLLLSNIDNATSECDIEKMVNRCLGAPVGDCVNIVKLVSRRIDCRLLDYISFRVILKWKWKELAMDASTWPNGIKFREFQHRHCNIWRPRP